MENIGNQNKTYRIKANVGSDTKLDVQLDQTYDMLEILSLRIKPTNLYQLQQSNYGVVVGRVVANGGFGVPNAKVSIFVPMKEGDSLEKMYHYGFTSTNDLGKNSIRYNVLPDEVSRKCHQDIGTLPAKSFMLDNDILVDVFKDYYALTTSTNSSGDYMIFGVPTGMQQLHMDVDLSDIGMLSQTPRDMIYKGYNLNLFESPTKFKSSTDLDSLPQIQSQTKSVYVYPYWGETNEMGDNIAITRCDIKLAYEFEPTCIFIGSAITDRGSNAVGKKCVATDECGKMSELTTGEGSIEMIRYNINGNIEECSIMGNRLIDGDGTWCYQIPMNLDYVTTDEFGNMVPTDDPTKGIPTRAKVRFRIAMDEIGDSAIGRKKARYLVPNNPDTNYKADYSFGSDTREESFVNLLWNKVYTVKNYIPRIEKSRKAKNKRISKTREHTGIKGVNHSGKNNPMPYNNITLKLNFAYKFRCILLKTIIMFMLAVNTQSWFLNTTLVNVIVRPITTALKIISYVIPRGSKIREKIRQIEQKSNIPYVALDPEFCMLEDDKAVLYVPCALETKGIKARVREQTAFEEAEKEYGSCAIKIVKASNFEETELSNCIEIQLAEEKEVIFYNFYNDWINGNLYFPLWFRKYRKARKLFFGLIKTKERSRWCSDDKSFKVVQRETCDESLATKKGVPGKKLTSNNEFKQYTTRYSNQAYGKSKREGLVHTETTMLDEIVYYYNADWFKTDIVLLGSLDEYDRNGIPQFFKYLPITTYQKPNNIRTTDADDETIIEMSGENWSIDRRGSDQYSTGLFYQLGCLDANILMLSKTCFNVKRICELGVDLDQRYMEENGTIVASDGLITKDEIINDDARAMFATMNDYNVKEGAKTRLSVERNADTSMMEYQFLYTYGKGFDSLNWREKPSINKDYKTFRGGYDDGGVNVTKRKNSYYFYFGLNEGKTAIEKFNSQFFAECDDEVLQEDCFTNTEVSDWCADVKENKIIVKTSKIVDYPITIVITKMNDNGGDEVVVNEKLDEKSLNINNNTKSNYYMKEYQFDSYGSYSVNVTNSDGTLYDKIVELVPDNIDISTSVLEFNISQEKLKSIIPSLGNKDASLISYSNDTFNVSGNGVEYGVYQSNTDNEGCASRKVKVGDNSAEMGGSIALTLVDDDYKWKDCVIDISGNYTIDDKDYTYHQTYVGSQIRTYNYKEDVDGTIVTTPVACLYVPYGDVTYKVKVTHKCANGVVNDVDNVWESDITVGKYETPVVTFTGGEGRELTLNQIKFVLSKIGDDEVWGNMIDNGGLLDIMVNDDNKYLKKIWGTDSQYQDLKKVIELNEYEEIPSGVDDDVIKEINEINAELVKSNMKMARELLIDFYHIFTSTMTNDGLTVSCNNDVTGLTFNNVSYRVITFDMYNNRIVNYYSGKNGINLTKFNGLTSDFSTTEIMLLGDYFNYENKSYDEYKNSTGITLKVSDYFGEGSDTLKFYLFDKRMYAEVDIISDYYKYEGSKNTNGYNMSSTSADRPDVGIVNETIVEQTYKGSMSIKIKNGFENFTVANMYDNWKKTDIGYLVPVDEDGQQLGTNHKIKLAKKNYDVMFTLPSDWDSSNIIINDGVGNSITVSGASLSGCCYISMGGILVYSTDFETKYNMRNDYETYMYDGNLNGWYDCNVTYNDDVVSITEGEDVKNWNSRDIDTVDGVTFSSAFRSSRNLDSSGAAFNRMMRVVGETSETESLTLYRLTRVTTNYFCDRYSFYGDAEASINGNPKDTHSFEILTYGAAKFITSGLYFTWQVDWEEVEDGWETNYDVQEGIKSFYIDSESVNSSDLSTGRVTITKHGDGSEVDKYNDAGDRFNIQTGKCGDHRVHWMQDAASVYRTLGYALDLGKNFKYVYGGYYRDGSDKPETGEHMLVSKTNNNIEKHFIWMDWDGNPRYGCPINMIDMWLYYDQIDNNHIFKYTGAMITNGQIPCRFCVKHNGGL